MTPPTPTHTHIWDGSRALPDWLTGHRWSAGQLVIRTPDGDTRPQPGWWLIAWSDGSVTAASPTSGERVYGVGGITDRLAHAETELRTRPAPAGLRDQLAAAIDQAIEDDNLDNLTDFSERLTGAVLAAVTQHLDIGDAQAWCKYCRRAWDSPAHRCESDAEQRVQKIADLRDQWLTAWPPVGQPVSRWVDARLAELTAVLNEEQPGPLTPTEQARLAQDGIDTPGCTCGHDGMGVSWHGDDCPWRRSVVDCPGRPALGPAAHNDGPSVEECREADRAHWTAKYDRP